MKVLVFGYCYGIRSSRKLARLLDRDIPFRFLAANQQLDYRTNGDFRKRNQRAFEHLFEEILALCQEADLVELGRVALDGQRIQGDAALAANFTRDQLREKVEEADAIDEKEDELYGPDNRGDEFPEELRDPEQRIEKIQELIDRLDEREEELMDEQAEKIRQREQEERETGKKKKGSQTEAPRPGRAPG